MRRSAVWMRTDTACTAAACAAGAGVEFFPAFATASRASASACSEISKSGVQHILRLRVAVGDDHRRADMRDAEQQAENFFGSRTQPCEAG